MDSVLLAQAIDYLVSERDLYYIHSLSIVRHGHVVADVYFYPYPPGTMHNLASTTKVFMTTLIGIAIDMGYIANVDERVIDFFPDRTIANLDDRKRSMTLQHLLTMTSGLGSDDETDTNGMEASTDWVQFALDLPMSHEPGTWWNYHQPTAFLLSAILTEATGMSSMQFAREHLFKPLHIHEAHWTANLNGINHGYNELKLAPHDLAKLGQLFLHRGSWEGEQIVSTSWVETATSVLVGDFYGYMWNHYPDFPGFYQGGGALGQRLIVAPSRDLVVVFTGGGYAHEDIERIYLEALDSHIFPAVQSSEALPPNPAGVAQLDDAIRRAASTERDPQPVDPFPAIADVISGTTFVFDDNPFELYSGTLWFPSADEARFRIISSGRYTLDPDFVWAAGLDGIERLGPGQLGIPAAGTGGWQPDETFVMNVDLMGMLERFRLTFTFEDGGNRLSLLFEDMDWWRPEPPIVFTGTAQP
jgi:hypothetical protein